MPVTKMTIETRRDNAALLLREKFTPRGTRIYGDLRHMTTNGTRYYDFYVVTDDKRIQRITSLVSQATGYTYDLKRECIKTQSDIIDIVHALARKLYADSKAFDYDRL